MLGGLAVARRREALLLVVAITAAAAWSAKDIEIETSIRSWFLDDDPVLVSYAAFQEHFGADEVAVIAVQAADDGPDGLGVFAPTTLAVVDRLRAGAAEAPHVVRVRSLLDAPLVRHEDGGVVVGPLADGPPTTVPQARRLRERALGSALLRDLVVTADGRMTLVAVELDPEHTDLPDKIAFADGLRALLDRERAAAPGLELRMAGLPVVDSTLGGLAMGDAFRVGPVSSLVIVLVGWLIFGRIRTAIVPLLVVGLAALWTFGFIHAVGWTFGILGGPLLNVVLAVGVADSVHVLADTQERISAGAAPREALRDSLSELLLPCFFTSITTAAGLLALLTSDVGPIREFGVVAAFGAVAAFFLTFTFLPVFATWVKPPSPAFLQRRRRGAISRFLATLADPPPGSGKVVLSVFAVVLVASAWGLTRVHVGADVIGYFRDDTPVRLDTLAIEEAAGGSGTIEFLVEAGPGGLRDPAVLHRLEELERWLVTQPGVTSVRSVLDVLRETRQALWKGDPAHARLPETTALAAQLYLLFEGADGLQDLVQDDASIGRMTARIELSRLEHVIALAPRLDRRLRDDYAAAPAVSATGYGLLFARLEGYLVDSQVRGLLVAFLAITLMLALLLRSPTLGLVAMIPNLAPVAVGLAIMAALDIPLDPGTLMVGPLALGLVVDDTVHFLVRYRRLRGEGLDAHAATSAAVLGTGRAITMTTVLLSASFMTLLMAGTAMAMHFGVIAAIVCVLALVADLVVLPAALRLGRPGPGAPPGAAASSETAP